MDKYIFLLVTILISLQSCKSQYLFEEVKSYKNPGDIDHISDGFIGIDEMITLNKILYKRYLLKKNQKVIVDGYWYSKKGDTISLVPYQSYKNECSKDKLIFFIRDKKRSYYLGRGCENELQYPTDVLVEFERDSLIGNYKYYQFSHSIISIDDYNDSSDAIIAYRKFLFNFKKGIVLCGESDEDYSPYWFNY